MRSNPTRTREAPREILIVDDDPAQVALLAHWLERAHPEVARRVAVTGGEALAWLEGPKARHLALVLLDLGLPDIDGLRVLAAARQGLPELPIAVLTLATDVQTVVSSMRAGASDYLPKPVDHEQLLRVVARALEAAALREHDRPRRAKVTTRVPQAPSFPGLIGASPPMQTLFRQMERVASRDVTVLIQGESGTGKELIARALHERGARPARPFVAINCAAIPEGLQESELFGHEKGAFTGATARHLGRFEQADGGTLFLDEIGEVAPSLQAKLLRAIQERRFHRVGGTSELRVDVRIIAATHRDLMREVAAGRFREDLYYRLAVFELGVPPLRARGDDVLAIAEGLLEELARRHGVGPLSLSSEAVDAMLAYDWPGNVRELQNALERAMVLANDEIIRIEDLPPRLLMPRPSAREVVQAPPFSLPEPSEAHAPTPSARPRSETLAEVEKRLILESLERAGGNVSEVCRRLGIPRTSMYRKLKRLGIDPEGVG